MAALTVGGVKAVSFTSRCIVGDPKQQALDVAYLLPNMMLAVQYAYDKAESGGPPVIRAQGDLATSLAYAWWRLYMCASENGLDQCGTIATEDSPAATRPGAHVISGRSIPRTFSLSFLPEGAYGNDWAEMELHLEDDTGNTDFTVWLDWQDCGGKRVPATVRNAFIRETD